MLQTVQQDTKQHAMKLTELQTELIRYSRENEQILKMLRGNNGTDGIQVRMALVEKAISTTAEGFKEVKEILETISSENSKGKWALMVGIVTGILGLMGIIIAAILRH